MRGESCGKERYKKIYWDKFKICYFINRRVFSIWKFIDIRKIMIL